MFTTVKSRLAAVAAAAWLAGAFMFGRMSDEYLFSVLVGLVAIPLIIYGAFWVVEGKGIEPFKVTLPRWAAYVLIAAMAILIMGLPKAISF